MSYPPTPRRVGIKSRPTDIDSPDDRYMTGHPTLAKPEVVFFLGQSLCYFSPMGGREGVRRRAGEVGGCSASLLTDQVLGTIDRFVQAFPSLAKDKLFFQKHKNALK